MQAAPCRKNWKRWRRAWQSARPVVAIVGGAKVSTKIDLLMNLVKKVDALVIGGGMANTFIAARGTSVGKSLCEHDLAETAKQIMIEAASAQCAIVLPVDGVVAREFKANAEMKWSISKPFQPMPWFWMLARSLLKPSMNGLVARIRWSGTARLAPSKSRPSIRRRLPLQNLPQNKPRLASWYPSQVGRYGFCAQPCGCRRQLLLRLDCRWCLP